MGAGQLAGQASLEVVNAKDAMPAGGCIVLEVEHLELGAGEHDVRGPLAEGRYVRIAVSDDGQGIPPELIPKIFDAFFTTKEDRGTGLGLSNVYEIAHQAGGGVRVESEAGQGSTLIVLLPDHAPS